MNLTLASLQETIAALPPKPDLMRFFYSTESQFKFPHFFAQIDKHNRNPFGGTCIPMVEMEYMPVDFGVLENITKQSYALVYYR